VLEKITDCLACMRLSGLLELQVAPVERRAGDASDETATLNTAASILADNPGFTLDEVKSGSGVNNAELCCGAYVHDAAVQVHHSTSSGRGLISRPRPRTRRVAGRPGWAPIKARSVGAADSG
jgi:hypothetical protein